MSNRIIAGRFDAEKDWNDDHTACLPSINSIYYEQVIAAMDELLIAYCGRDDDILITETALNTAHLKYMGSYGIKCRNLTYEEFRESCQFAGEDVLDTYAVTEEYINFAENHGLIFKHPDSNIIKAVNSKFYSVELSRRLGINHYSCLVSDIDEFKKRLDDVIKIHGKAMVKEEYGVSGKGNMVVDAKKFQRLLKNTMAQTEKGKGIRYIVEPMFEVNLDFSSQWHISSEGKVQFISIQEILNNGSAYGGSVDAAQDTLDILTKNDYFLIMEGVCHELNREGYFGDICIDSMIVKNNKLIPVVEINARKSMSLTKVRFDQFFKEGEHKNRISCMVSRDIVYQSDLTYMDIVEIFYEYGIGYHQNSGTGIIPVTCNTLFANRNVSKEQSRGRVYCFAMEKDRRMLENLFTRLNGIKVFEKKVKG